MSCRRQGRVGGGYVGPSVHILQVSPILPLILSLLVTVFSLLFFIPPPACAVPTDHHDKDLVVAEPGTVYHKTHLRHSKGQLVGPSGHEIPLWNPDLDVVEVVQEPHHRPEIVLHEEPKFRAVQVDEFKLKATRAENYYDVLRLFLGEGLSEEAIDAYMLGHRHDTRQHSHPEKASGGGGTLEGLLNISPQDMERWQQTQTDTHRHAQCVLPVAQTVRIRDLTHRGDVEYIPECVIVYRCRQDSGCCPSGQLCGPRNSTSVTKTILNDTDCQCLNVPEIKERPCPYPFNHSLLECVCVKASLHQQCEQIAKGRQALAEPQIKCIEKGDCRPLDPSVCEGFDVKTGRCPRPRRHSKVGREPVSSHNARGLW